MPSVAEMYLAETIQAFRQYRDLAERSLSQIERDSDLFKEFGPRSHYVIRAIQRSLSHTAYHVGQITYLTGPAKEGEWTWLTVPPMAVRI